MHVFKIGGPKAFCKGDAGYPISTYVPKGVEHIEKYSPHGRHRSHRPAMWFKTSLVRGQGEAIPCLELCFGLF
jgi:hypothetical protein